MPPSLVDGGVGLSKANPARFRTSPERACECNCCRSARFRGGHVSRSSSSPADEDATAAAGNDSRERRFELCGRNSRFLRAGVAISRNPLVLTSARLVATARGSAELFEMVGSRRSRSAATSAPNSNCRWPATSGGSKCAPRVGTWLKSREDDSVIPRDVPAVGRWRDPGLRTGCRRAIARLRADGHRGTMQNSASGRTADAQ